MMNIKDKKETIKKTIDLINKTYGAGSIGYLSDTGNDGIECISTGSIGLDLAIGGGFPKGRIIELYGLESSGKTTIAMHAIKECQDKGGIALFVDAEHSFDKKYAKSLGIDLDFCLLIQESGGEKALNMVESVVRDRSADLIVVDSVASLVPLKESEGDMGDANMGVMARLMSQALRKLTGLVSKTGVCVIFINQLREKIGGYGNPYTTTGGNALKFYSSVRLDVKRSSQVKDGDEVIASETLVKVVKNKISAPFKTAQFKIKFGTGIDRFSEVVDFAIALELIEKAGAWFTIKSTKDKAHGRPALEELLRSTPDLLMAIERDILEKININVNAG